MQVSKHLFLLILLLCPYAGNAQPCTYSVSGRVLDKAQLPVPGAVVYLSKTKLGTVTDADGKFTIDHICNSADTLVCEATGFKHTAIAVDTKHTSKLKITVITADNDLQEVVISGQKVADDVHTQTQTVLTARDLQLTRGETLGEVMKNMPGLNSSQTGPSLSKPVIHGMHSNRVLIINNGVRQEGQQWGSEHAPEIDPFTANKITLVKGAASIRYGADAIAGVILLSPDELPTEKGIKGNVYLVGASNGRQGTVSGTLEGAFDKKLEGLAWRIQGSVKEGGNFSTPNYYLYNTGVREGDFSASLGYKWKGLNLNTFYSQYNTQVGIFTGSESTDINDLLAKFALQRPETPSIFSYHIDRGYQTIGHDMFKFSAGYQLANKGTLELVYAAQNDLRQEFGDVPANPALANSPELSFHLLKNSLDLVYTQYDKNGLSGSMGISGNTSDNVSGGFQYLVPNYLEYGGGAFAIERYNINKLTLEAGIRYDYRFVKAYQHDSTGTQSYNSSYTYQNVTGAIGGIYHFNDRFNVNLNVGTAWRAPSIDELFIRGAHFSDASYDIGDSTLKSERAVNTSLSFNYKSNKLRVAVDLYYNNIGNYIYKMPALRTITVDGSTFPVFLYRQDKVNIKGVDADLEYDLLPQLTFISKTTIVRGYNETIHDYLTGMPSDRFQNALSYHLPRLGKIQEPYISVENVSVSKQTRIAPNTEFVPAPASYSLFNANAGCAFLVHRHKLNLDVEVKNFTNVAYRDYLDHFRYYADELGINYVLRVKYSF